MPACHVDPIQIECFLWDHGLTPNYSGFFYLRTALQLALAGTAISSELLSQTADLCRCTRNAVYQGIQIALGRMDGLPRVCSRQRVYILIHYIAQQLKNER